MRPISIWEPVEVDGQPAFARPPVGPRGDHYADRDVILKRSPRPRRVVLLGESAAAGYLLAPDYTPAKVLQAYLGEQVDVVDLARTNERIESLRETAQAAMQLDPEALIVFAGNNWNLLETPWASPLFPDRDSRRAHAAACRAGGLLGPAQHAARTIREGAESLFDGLASLEVRVIVVVPEVNLVDWPRRQPVPWLDGKDAARWHALERSTSRLSGRTVQRARRMIALDRGRGPTGFDRLAHALLERGQMREALRAFRGSVDSDHYALMATLSAPQATHRVQEILRRCAAQHGFDLVDLPRRFEGGRPPDRTLFYDYCHLTPQGISEAMQPVAALLGAERFVAPALSSSTRWRAALGAAIHGVHRGARGAIVRYWIDEAIAESDRARDAIDDVIAARLAPVPAELTRGQLHGHGLNPQHGWEWPDLDAELLQAFATCTGSRHNAPRPQLEPWGRLDRFYPDAMIFEDTPRRAAFRTPWPRSDLALSSCGGPVELRLCLRVPHAARARVTLAHDGRPLASTTAGPTWHNWTIRGSFPPGLHRLTLRWPFPSEDGSEALDQALTRLEEGREATLHPVFGELFDYRAMPA